MTKLLTHPHDGHRPAETCLKCVEAVARSLYSEEYAGLSDTWEEADGWERELFRRRAQEQVSS